MSSTYLVVLPRRQGSSATVLIGMGYQTRSIVEVVHDLRDFLAEMLTSALQKHLGRKAAIYALT